MTSTWEILQITSKMLKECRELYIKSGHGFLLVFSITSLSSLYELSRLREQIIRIKEDETIPLVIVGNKSDLERERVVSRSEAFSISHSWGNTPYYETSARRRGKPPPLLRRQDTQLQMLINTANVDEVFIDLCRQIIRKRKIEGWGNDDEIDYEPDPGLDHNQSRRRRGRRRLARRESRCTIL
jgi:Ras-related protein Rap-1B